MKFAGASRNYGSGTVLYGTSACHLCDVAEQLLGQYARNITEFDYEKIDISDSDDLFSRYGLRIPVLCRDTGEELNWPFTIEDIRSFLEG